MIEVKPAPVAFSPGAPLPLTKMIKKLDLTKVRTMQPFALPSPREQSHSHSLFEAGSLSASASQNARVAQTPRDPQNQAWRA